MPDLTDGVSFKSTDFVFARIRLGTPVNGSYPKLNRLITDRYEIIHILT